MKTKLSLVAALCGLISLAAWGAGSAGNETNALPEAPAPHTPTLIFYLIDARGQKDADAIRAAVQPLKSASTIEVNTNRSFARIRFDSHVVSYHQVAQAVADAGGSLGKHYDPFLIFVVPDYARTNNAEKVDAIFAGKRLNTRVKVTALDKSKGTFAVHFLPLQPASGSNSLPGFNGGHLHHPISDPPPRGLGLPSGYASQDDGLGKAE